MRLLTVFMFSLSFFSAFAKDLRVESLDAFQKRTFAAPIPIPGTTYHSWNVGDAPKYFVSFPATDEMGRKGPADDYPVIISAPKGELAVLFALFEASKIRLEGLSTCPQLGNHLWQTPCPGGQCHFMGETKLQSDGVSYLRYKLKYLYRGVERDAYYQCSLGKEKVISIMAVFVSAFGPFKKSADLEKVLSHVSVSEAAR